MLLIGDVKLMTGSNLSPDLPSRLAHPRNCLTRSSRLDPQGKFHLSYIQYSALTRLNFQLLKYNPEERLPLSEVLVHPWIKKYERKKSSSTGVVAGLGES